MRINKSILTVVTAVLFALSPFFVSGFNGFRPDQFPVPQVNVPVQPAGYAFSIWGVIYLWLIAGGAFGLWNQREEAGWQPMRAPLILSLAIGATWIPVAQVSAIGATVLIWAMLTLALLALLRAGQADRGWQRTPVALYAGWLTAASSVSVGLVLGGFGWTSNQTAAVIGILLALVVAMTVQARRRDTPEYSGAVIWALVGVVVSNLEPLNMPILLLCAVGIAALAWQALRTPRH